MTIRLFVAVDVPSSVKGAIEDEVVGPLRDEVPGARWTRPEGRHLTLKFLGWVEEERADEISAAVQRAASGRSAFDAGFAEVGGFPNLGRPRVLWVGLGEGAEETTALAAEVERELAPLGFEAEGRPFHGHLTLARFKRPKRIEVPTVEVPRNRFRVTELTLFRSHLHPEGARYEALRTFSLRS